jgi:hypothetical protein
MAMKKKAPAKKAAPKKNGASDKAKKAQSARLQKDAEARKKSGQSYVDKRNPKIVNSTQTAPIGMFYNDMAGTQSRTMKTPESMKKTPTRSGTHGIYRSRRTGEVVPFGPYGRTAQRGVDQAKRAGEKRAKKAGKK